MDYVFLTPDTLGMVSISDGTLVKESLKTLSLDPRTFIDIHNHIWTDAVTNFLQEVTGDIICTERIIYNLAKHLTIDAKLSPLDNFKALKTELRTILYDGESEKETKKRFRGHILSISKSPAPRRKTS
jgi:hypothetical protein